MIGRTRIELTNVNTGKTEIIEHKNTITEGIEKFLLGSGYFNNSPFNSSVWRGQALWRNLVGGIFLFKDAIQDDGEGNYPIIMPAGNKMIANGAYNVSNSTSITELGSWNSVESSVTEDTITMVYDWTTAQGNGTISSICLTSDVGGQIGYGNSTSNTSNSGLRKDLLLNQSSNNLASYVGTSNSSYTIKDNVLYWLGNSSTHGISAGTIDLKYRPIALDDLSIFTTTKTRTLTIPTTIASASTNKYYYPIANGKFLFTANVTTLSNGSSTTVGIYDCVADSWQTYTINNTTGVDVRIDTEHLINGGAKLICLSSANKTTYVYSFSAGTWQTIENGRYQASTVVGSCVELADDLFILYNSTSDWGYVNDLIGGTAYICNVGLTAEDNEDYQSIGNNLWSVQTEGVYRNPLYLATVNNLDSSVTKTAAQTMKVTYTLTKA